VAFFPTIVSIVSYAAAALLLGALVASVLRRWRQAATMSCVVVLLTPMVLVVSAIGFIGVPLVFPGGPAAKAIALAVGVSETLNCGVVAYLSFLPAVVLWVLARQRLRERRR
jgi:hypothetical protein